MTVVTKFKVVVHYPGAGEPFKDDEADPGEVIGHLKTRVLAFFDLVEGQTPEGNTITYILYEGKQALDNPEVTLSQLAGDKHVLQLKLAQQIVQGR